MPLISMIMSTYSRNRPEGGCPNLLKRSLDSIVNQTFKDFELILMDDGSTDGTEIVCREYAEKHKFIKYIRFEENSGFPAKRYNDGIDESCGDYIMFMFDDDKIYPNAIKELYDCITGKYASFSMVYGLVNYMNASTGGPLAYNFGGEWNIERIKTQNFLCNNSVIVKRSVLEDVGGYDESSELRRLCDWELWRRIGLKYPVSRVPILVGEVYAYHKDSIGVLHEYDMKQIFEHINNPKREIRFFKPSKKKINKRITFVHHGHDPSLKRWRIHYLEEALTANGFKAETIHMIDPMYSRKCLDSDIIVFYRCYYPQADFIKKLVSLKKIVIYDIDDYVFQSNGKYNSHNDVSLINAYFASVNCVMASTQKLLDQIPFNGKNKIVRENFINKDTFDILSVDKKVPNKNFRVGWLSGINRVEMHDFIFSFLVQLSKKCPGCDFYYFGRHDKFYTRINSIKGIKIVRVDYVPTENWKELYETFKRCNFDVVINPLDEKDIFMNCKSAIKMAETGPMQVPLITSKTWPFEQHIKDGENGMFASGVNEFVDKVIYLKNNVNERLKIGENAKKYSENFLADKYIDSIIQAFEAVVEATRTPPKAIKQKHESPSLMPTNVVSLSEKVFNRFTCKRDGLSRISLMVSCDDNSSDKAFHVMLKRLQDDLIVVDKVYYYRPSRDNSWASISFPVLKDSGKKDFELCVNPISSGGINVYYASGDNDKFEIGDECVKGSLCFKLSYDDSEGERPSERVLISLKSSFDNVLGLIPIAKNLVEERGDSVYLETNCHGFINSKYISGVYALGGVPMGNFRRVDLTNSLEVNPENHFVDFYSVKVLGHHYIDKTIDIDISEDDVMFVETLMAEKSLVKKGYIVFHEHAGTANRTWPLDRWCRLEAHCLASGLNVVVVGMGRDFMPRMPGAVNLVNRLSVPQMKYLIDNSKCVVTPDSFVLQLCGSSDVKVIAIYLSTLPEYRTPYRDKELRKNVTNLLPALECSGCWYREITSINYAGCRNRDFKCITTITPKMVYDAIVDNH